MDKKKTEKLTPPPRSAFDSALNSLSIKSRTQKEIEDTLRKKGYAESEIAEALEKLNRYSYIDDIQYARQAVSSAGSGVIKGKKMLAFSLKNKGVSEEIIEQVLSELPEEEELDKAVRLAQSVLRKNTGKAPLQLKQKLWRALADKGFEFDVISEAVRVVNQAEDY